MPLVLCPQLRWSARQTLIQVRPSQFRPKPRRRGPLPHGHMLPVVHNGTCQGKRPPHEPEKLKTFMTAKALYEADRQRGGSRRGLIIASQRLSRTNTVLGRGLMLVLQQHHQHTDSPRPPASGRIRRQSVCKRSTFCEGMPSIVECAVTWGYCCLS